ncbi:hypothetical protein C8J25_107262 [Sphingomonas faeni]|uniref:Uncharacterized protein n=1 Tax=Sphingomonas faeni TaxID=185950 RepID=A0A2T5U248_9SPHN|nr:hypothetical protein C8J25_107262 [Sphingomonas faeni]
MTFPRLKQRLHRSRDRAVAMGIGDPPNNFKIFANGTLMARPHSQTIRMSARCRMKSVVVSKCALPIAPM